MVISSQNSSNSNDAKSSAKTKRPPSLSFSRIGKSKSLLHLGGEKPCPPEPDYEEIGPPRRKPPDGVQKPCDLCGSSEAAVRCDKCGSQCFCLACDDMYHRHPRRCNHSRKTVDSGPDQVKPPLPPKGVDALVIPPPQPPPRKNKRPSFLSNASFMRKDNGSSEGAGKTIMGSIKRIMGSRPLPPPPPPQQQQQSNKRPESESRINSTPSRPQSRNSNRPSTAPATPNNRDNMARLDNESDSPKSSLRSQRDTKYQPLIPARAPPPPPPIGPHRKLSLQQLPSTSFEDKRASLVEGSSSASQWDSDSGKAVQRMRSQSISDEQWAQMMAAQAAAQFTQGHTQQDIAAIAAARRGFNASGSSTRPSNFNNRGMVSSASVCDLNSLSHQPQQQQMMNSQGANSFQQLNMMGYTPGMMWPPCELCQGVPMGYPSSVSSNGMKRTASNLSMNLSSVGSDVSTGYPWAPPPPHMHHHMPFYPGCYPPPGCHSHMTHGVPMQGSAVSIPDSMQSFNKVPPSPAPSVRSSSHRSHKSSKSRSFSNADAKSSRSSRNKSRHQSEESEESLTSSGSEDGEAKVTKNTFPNSHLAWQCDHCTFINPGNARACGMCSKTTAIKHNRKGSDKKRSERRKDKEKSRKTDHEDDDRNISDYDNENSVLKSNLSLGIKDYKKETRLKSNKSSNRYRKKSRRRDSSYDSASPSISDLEDEERQLERQLKELRLTARSRQSGDYEASQNRSRNKDRNSRRKEGKRK